MTTLHYNFCITIYFGLVLLESPRIESGIVVSFFSRNNRIQISRREAFKVENLMVSVWHLNEDGLVSRGIGPKTASMMSELLDKTSEWQTPQSWSRALFLKLDKAQSSSGLLYDHCIVRL